MARTPDEPRTYYTVINGKFVTKVGPDTPGAKKRVNKNGKEVWELVFRDLSGVIKWIGTKSHDEYGLFLNIHMEDEQGEYVVQFGFKGRHAGTFMSIMPNINFEREVQLSPRLDSDGKDSLFVRQNDITLKHFFTNANPNGRPAPIKKEIGNTVEWDFSPQHSFFFQMIEKKIQPMLKKLHAVDNSQRNTADEIPEDIQQRMEADKQEAENMAKDGFTDQSTTEVDGEHSFDDLPFD